MKKRRPRPGTIKKRLDALWSRLVRERDRHRCIMCGKVENLQAHHWFVRRARSMAVRWVVENGATLCYYCHLCQLHRYADRAFVQRFFNTMNDIVDAEAQERMEDLAREPAKFSVEDLLMIEADLTKRLGAYTVSGIVFGRKA